MPLGNPLATADPVEPVPLVPMARYQDNPLNYALSVHLQSMSRILFINFVKELSIASYHRQQ
jgi:hypothetical protein